MANIEYGMKIKKKYKNFVIEAVQANNDKKENETYLEYLKNDELQPRLLIHLMTVN